jgi:hypothetical protein
MFSTLNLLRQNNTLKSALKLRSRDLHNTKGRTPDYSAGSTFDQYSAHSPLQHSRFRLEELRSKIFFDHPPIPNRIPKFIMLFFIMATFSTGVRDKVRRRNKKFVKEEEKKLFRLIVPFVQAMEDVRFTAIDQKNYMVYKAVSDATQPGHFENIRWRFHQEDI